MSKGTTRRSIRVDDELWEHAHTRAAEQGDNLSAIIRDALRRYVGESDTQEENVAEVAEVM
jgi:Arc/MetJ family transcription regulator